MPLLPPVMQSLIQQRAALKLLSGSKMPSTVSAISSATCMYLLSFSNVNSTNNVLGPGVGSQIGRIGSLIPSMMSDLILKKAKLEQMSGKDLASISEAVSFGVVNALKAVVIQGTVIGGGPGTGIGYIVGLSPSALKKQIMGQEFFRLMSGAKLGNIISAISFGICNHIMTAGIVNITNIGAAAPPPVGPIPIPAAPGIGRFY